MAFSKWPTIRVTLISVTLTLGILPAPRCQTPPQTQWAPVDGPSPAPVQSVVVSQNVVLASGTRQIFRSLSAEGPWSSSNLSDARNAEFMEAIDSLVFAYHSTNLYRSTDHGLTWIATQGNVVIDKPIRIFKSNGSLALVTTEGQYFSSTDQGLTWKPYQESPSGYAYGQLLIHDSLIFAGTDNGLFVSSNKGGSWRRLRGGLPAEGQTYLLEQALGKLFVADAQGLYVSSNKGETWSKVDGGLARAGVEYGFEMSLAASRNLLLLASPGRAGVMGSRDSGKTWTQLNQGLPSSRLNGVLHYSSSDIVFQEDTALVSTSAGIYRSTNEGALWTFASRVLPQPSDGGFRLRAVGTDLYSVIFAEEESPTYRSADGGRTWEKANSLLRGLRLMRAEGNERFAMTDWGIMRSPDGGKSWVSVPGPWRSSQGPIAFDFRGADLVVAHHFDGATLFHSSDKGATWDTEVHSRPSARLGDLHFQAVGKGLRISTTGGRTWTDLPMVFPDTVGMLHGEGGILALLSGTGLFISADSGLTWKRPEGILENLPVASLAMVGTQLYAATEHGLMLSSNGGERWKLLKQGLPVDDIKALAASEGRLFAVDNQGLHLREKADTAWKILSAAPSGIHQLSVWKTHLLVATRANELWISRDIGATWEMTGESISGEPALSLALGQTQGFVSLYKGLYSTSDTGKTWQPVLSANLIPAPTAMAIGSNDLYAVAGMKTYRSHDGGVRWAALPATIGWSPQFLAAEGSQLFGADVNGVHSSSDQGHLWAWTAPTEPFNPIVHIAYTNGQVFIAGREGNGIKVLEQLPTGLQRFSKNISANAGIRLETDGGATVFRFHLPGKGRVSWEIFSVDGKRANAFTSQGLIPGTYDFPWGIEGGHSSLLYRAEIRFDDPFLKPVRRMGRRLP